MPYAPKWAQLEEERERECLVGYNAVYFCGLPENMNLVHFIIKGSNINESKPRRLQEKHTVVTWKLGTISVFP
jgi:hypothetical protein